MLLGKAVLREVSVGSSWMVVRVPVLWGSPKPLVSPLAGKRCPTDLSLVLAVCEVGMELSLRSKSSKV